MVPHIPPELRIQIAEELVNDDHPSAFIWAPDVKHALLALTLTDRSWRAIVQPYIYRRVTIHSRRDIDFLHENPSRLALVRALALLPGRVNYQTWNIMSWSHDYCTQHLEPLFKKRELRTLERLFIMHNDLANADLQNLTEVTPETLLHSCSKFKDGVGCLIGLRELIVDKRNVLFPTVYHPEEPPTVDDDGMIVDIEDEGERYIPGWPSLPTLVGLATNREVVWWRDFEYSESFPSISSIVGCDWRLGEPEWDAHVERVSAQLINPEQDLKMTSVHHQQSRERIRRAWNEYMPSPSSFISVPSDVPSLPLDRFLFEFVDEPVNIWFLRNALQGTVFEVAGKSFSSIPVAAGEVGG